MGLLFPLLGTGYGTSLSGTASLPKESTPGTSTGGATPSKTTLQVYHGAPTQSMSGTSTTVQNVARKKYVRFTTQELQILEEAFSEDKCPKPDQMHALAMKLQVGESKIKVWTIK